MERRQRHLFFGLSLLVALTAGGAAGVVASVLLAHSLGDYATALVLSHIPATPADTALRPTSVSTNDALSRIADVAAQSVAVITPSTLDGRLPSSWITESDAVGYGVVVGADGWILVTQETVAAFSNLRTQANVWIEGARHGVTQVIADDLTDFVLLKIDANGLSPVAFGASADVRNGTAVYATMGTRGVLMTTVVDSHAADGVPVASAESSLFHWNLAQTSEVSSPVFAASGDLLAFAESNVALPIHMGNAFVQSVLRDGTVTHPGLGITVVDLSLPLNVDTTLAQGRHDGALVMAPVLRNGPAQAAGIVPGDIITEVDDVRIDGTVWLAEILSKYRVGDRATFTVVRDGTARDVEVTFGVYEDLLY